MNQATIGELRAEVAFLKGQLIEVMGLLTKLIEEHPSMHPAEAAKILEALK